VAVPRIASLYYPTKEEVVDLFLRRVRINGERYGHTINVAVGSELWLRANALAGIVCHAFSNNKIALQQYSPLTAEEDKLLELAAQFGVEPRTGAKSTGAATARCTGVVIIPDGYLATAPNGEKFELVGPETVTTSGAVTLRAVNAGTAGNLSAGTVLTWDSASIGFLQRTMTVTGGGITGGTETDTWSEVKDRLLLKLKSPPVGTNWAQIREWTLASTSSVARCFVYPAVRGPGTVDVCVIGEDNAVLSDAVCDEVEAYVAGEFSDHADLSVTSIYAEEVDAVMALRLPSSTSTTGGGWTDATPWPSDAVRITAVASDVITTDLAFGADDPAIGTTVRIHAGSSWLGPFSVTAAADDGGFLELTLSAAPGAVTGCYLSADCESIEDYAATFADAFAELGPGEKSTSGFVLPRGKRRPTTDTGDYIRAGHRLESALMSATSAEDVIEHPEIEDARVVVVRLTGTTTAQYTPSVPASAGDPPRMLILANMAFIHEDT
jgi:uncharacterized phage protein gp47/JayE